MRSLWRTLRIGMVIVGIALPALGQSPLPRSAKEYTFNGRLSATNLMNVIGPDNVRVTVRLLWGGRVIGATDEFNLRPIDTTRDTWVGEFQITATVPEGVYVRLVAGSGAVYPDGTAMPLRGTTVVFTGVGTPLTSASFRS